MKGMGRTRGPHDRPTPREMASLARAAMQAARRAHAPYSGFRVGAALRDASGQVFLGANLENASYPLGVCAERVALLAWRADGGAPIRTVVVATPTDRPTPPCGLCRTALAAWAPDAEVFLAYRGGLSGPVRAADWLVHAPAVRSAP